MIYRLVDNINDFQDLDIDPFDFVEAMSAKNGLTYSEFERFAWDNRAFGADWVDVGGGFMSSDKKKPKPDIAMWSGPFLMLSPRAHTALNPALAPFGELLPFTVVNETWHLFNCLTLAEADESQSQPLTANGHWLGVKQLAFTEAETRDKLIFKTTYNRCSELYCSDALVKLIEVNGLSGLEHSPNLIPELQDFTP